MFVYAYVQACRMQLCKRIHVRSRMCLKSLFSQYFVLFLSAIIEAKQKISQPNGRKTNRERLFTPEMNTHSLIADPIACPFFIARTLTHSRFTLFFISLLCRSVSCIYISGRRNQNWSLYSAQWLCIEIFVAKRRQIYAYNWNQNKLWTKETFCFL